MRPFSVVLLVHFAVHVTGWGARGHMAIARVAFNLLSDRAHMYLSATTGTSVDINKFAQMSLWADRVRDHPDHSWSRELHYTHNAKCLSDVANFELQPAGCVLSAVQYFVNVLRNKDVTHPPSLSKKEALFYLVHFVGDLHAPFHIGDNTDMNGTNTLVSSAVWQIQRQMTLHYFWDHILDINEILTGDTIESFLHGKKQAASRGNKPISETVFEAACEAREVTTELGLVDGNGRLIQSGDRLSREYFQAACPAALNLIHKAGVRLAQIINDVADVV